MKDFYQIVIVGGGPAGSTCACLLADMGYDVAVFERSQFPRHHIGESLMPQTYWTFKRIGMLEKLKRSDFVIKESVQFVSASGKESQPYFFTDRDPNEWSVTWQVTRDRFDRMLLDHAAEHGARVFEGVRVSEVLFDGSRATGVQVNVNGTTKTIQAKVVVDATGVAALLSKQLKIREADAGLRNAAIYSYFKGAHRDEGRNAGATLVIYTPDKQGWFWSIPLPNDITSVGIVSKSAYLCTGRGDDPLATLEEEIANCPGISRRLEHAERIRHAYVTSDFTYRANCMAGDGWVLIGDAFGFLDPIYSSGVFLALKMAEFAADAIHDGLRADDTSAGRLGHYGAKLCRGMQLIRQLIYAFYNPSFSFAQLNKDHPEYHDEIVRLLIGDVFDDNVGAVFDVIGKQVPLPAPIPLQECAN